MSCPKKPVPFHRNKCILVSVFNYSETAQSFPDLLTDSLQSRLTLAVQSALRMRERSILGDDATYEVISNYHNTSVQVWV
mgnify:FL=1